MSAVEIATLIIGALTLLAAGGALLYAWRLDRRDTDRGDVRWVIQRHAGRVELLNNGVRFA